jgi:hypothetical protein
VPATILLLIFTSGSKSAKPVAAPEAPAPAAAPAVAEPTPAPEATTEKAAPPPASKAAPAKKPSKIGGAPTTAGRR